MCPIRMQINSLDSRRVSKEKYSSLLLSRMRNILMCSKEIFWSQLQDMDVMKYYNQITCLVMMMIAKNFSNRNNSLCMVSLIKYYPVTWAIHSQKLSTNFAVWKEFETHMSTSSNVSMNGIDGMPMSLLLSVIGHG